MGLLVCLVNYLFIFVVAARGRKGLVLSLFCVVSFSYFSFLKGKVDLICLSVGYWSECDLRFYFRGLK